MASQSEEYELIPIKPLKDLQAEMKKFREDLKQKNASPKEYLNILNNLDQLNSKTLMVLSNANKNIFLSSRNLKKAKVVRASDLCTYEIMNANKLLILEGSVKEIEETLNK